MKRIPQNRLDAFKIMCKQNGWNPVNVLTYLLEYAVDMNASLALPLYLRNKRQKSSDTRWRNPYEREGE